jgi:CubicO group peptidase (beta-lactamase class C family)
LLTAAEQEFDAARIDLTAVREASAGQGLRATPGIDDMAAYLAAMVADEAYHEPAGPLLPGSGASGVVVHRGWVVAEWGDASVPEMLFSATKTAVSAIAGVAFDRGLLDPHAPVAATVDLPVLSHGTGQNITWQHLLQQTSQWDGELWGKPAWAAAGHRRSEDSTAVTGGPGSGWAYNDVRVNLLCLALTALLGRPLPDVLRDDVLGPLGASSSWSWHGYPEAVVTVDGPVLPVVSGGAHWGGGLWMSAADLALLGDLYLRDGRCGDRQLLSSEWIERSWQPCTVKPEYGYLWWLNDSGQDSPGAPPSGRCARGNGGRHLLWVDPDRDLVITSHWGDDVALLVSAVSAAVETDSHTSRL